MKGGLNSRALAEKKLPIKNLKKTEEGERGKTQLLAEELRPAPKNCASMQKVLEGEQEAEALAKAISIEGTAKIGLRDKGLWNYTLAIKFLRRVYC